MKILKRKILQLALVAMAAVVLFTSCEDDTAATAVPGETLDATISSKADLSLLQAALEKTRLNIFTKGSGPFTLFAPNNAAFNAAGITSAADLALIDSNLLVQILSYHIQAGRRSFVEIPFGPNANMSTQGGLTQYASRKAGGSAYINGVQVIEPDIRASNGYMHIIDRLLLPPFLTTAQALASQPNFARFYQAVLKTGTVTTTNPLTILAVPNTVMIAAGYDSTTIANATGTALATLNATIKYHFIPRRIFSPDFVSGPLATVPVAPAPAGILTIGTAGGLTVKGKNNPAPFVITPTNLITTTGVIHTINGLLRP